MSAMLRSLTIRLRGLDFLISIFLIAYGEFDDWLLMFDLFTIITILRVVIFNKRRIFTVEFMLSINVFFLP